MDPTTWLARTVPPGPVSNCTVTPGSRVSPAAAGRFVTGFRPTPVASMYTTPAIEPAVSKKLSVLDAPLVVNTMVDTTGVVAGVLTAPEVVEVWPMWL